MKIPLVFARNGAPSAVFHTELRKTKGILCKNLHGGKRVHYVFNREFLSFCKMFPRILAVIDSSFHADNGSH